MPRLLLLIPGLLFGCLAEFPNPPGQFIDMLLPDAAPDAAPDLAVLDVTVPDGMTGCGTPETCDGFDEDCDDRVDESVPRRACPLQLGVCRSSIHPCLNGAYQPCLYLDTPQPYTLEEGPPSFCDGLDNDCDGALDEGCTCAPGDVRDCGSNEGACTSGRQLCENGIFGRCAGAIEPAIEQLNGTDDDCDGTIDEGPPPVDIVLDLADLAVGGLGERPGLPGQMAHARGLPLMQPGVLAERPAPLVSAVFIPTAGPCLIAPGVTFNFESTVFGPASAGLHGKGPAGLVPHPAQTLGLVEYQDPRLHSFIEIPANYGISFDLAAITRRFGQPAKRLRIRLGSLGPGRVTFLVIQDGQQLIHQTLVGQRELMALDVELLPLARVLTLATTNAGEAGTRAAYFGDAELHFR